MNMKKKIGTGVLAVALLAGGAVVGASSQSFGEYVDGATDSMFEKVAGWAGYTVHDAGKKKEKEIESHVESEFNRGAAETTGHFSTEVNRGKTLVNSEFTDLKKEITDSTNAEVADVKGRITDKVDEEVEEAKTDLNGTAVQKANELINSVKLPNVPSYE